MEDCCCCCYYYYYYYYHSCNINTWEVKTRECCGFEALCNYTMCYQSGLQNETLSEEQEAKGKLRKNMHIYKVIFLMKLWVFFHFCALFFKAISSQMF